MRSGINGKEFPQKYTIVSIERESLFCWSFLPVFELKFEQYSKDFCLALVNKGQEIERVHKVSCSFHKSSVSFEVLIETSFYKCPGANECWNKARDWTPCAVWSKAWTDTVTVHQERARENGRLWSDVGRLVDSFVSSGMYKCGITLMAYRCNPRALWSIGGTSTPLCEKSVCRR